MAQGVAVYAALRRAADTCGDGRSRNQVMADTLYERVTGRSADSAVPVAVNLVLSDQSLLGGDEAALVDGYGTVPAEIACRLIGKAVADEEAKATLRRVYARPDSGALVAVESRARAFPAGLARLIKLRDQRCRTPYCGAPVRHIDHITPHADGGATSAENGEGLCEQCNYLKELEGWKVAVAEAEAGGHATEVTTPTGHRHRSLAPPVLPGRRRYDLSVGEKVLFSHLGDAA
jgi:hypothetical protein